MDISRPIFITCPGPSLKILDDNIERFRDSKIYWFSLDLFPFSEEKILSKIGHKTNFTWTDNLSDPSTILFGEHINEPERWFLLREDVFLTHSFPKDKVRLAQAVERCGSVCNPIWGLKALGFKEFYIFGMNGGYHDGMYYLDGYLEAKIVQAKVNNISSPIERGHDLKNDTRIMNTLLYKERYLDVYNVNPESRVNLFKRININQIREDL